MLALTFRNRIMRAQRHVLVTESAEEAADHQSSIGASAESAQVTDPTQTAAWLDTGTADHSVETLVKVAGVAVGVSARLSDYDNRLYAEMTTAGLMLAAIIASSPA